MTHGSGSLDADRIKILKEKIRDIPDFPKKGIVFKDITTLLKDGPAFHQAVEAMVQPYRRKGVEMVVGVESRGFIFGAAMAYELNAGFVPVRKKGKLPGRTRCATYQLEYGTDTLEIHEDALNPGQKVLIVDDVLATGGTIRAVVDLVRSSDARVAGVVFLIELTFLEGRRRLEGLPVFSVLEY